MAQRAGRIIRRTDPEATVVCPGMGDLWQPESRAFLAEFATAGGYRYCDAAAVKLHQRVPGQAPETMLALSRVIDDAFHEAGVGLPIWNTGTAYWIATAGRLSEQQAENYAVRFYLVGLYGRVARMYFYNWGGTKLPIVLQAAGGPPTKAALEVQELQRWLKGARITSCGHGVDDELPRGAWECRFLLPAGKSQVQAAIRWMQSGSATMPSDGASRVSYLDRHSAAAGSRIRLTEQPVLIEFRDAV
jgi:hypothetical protein